MVLDGSKHRQFNGSDSRNDRLFAIPSESRKCAVNHCLLKRFVATGKLDWSERRGGGVGTDPFRREWRESMMRSVKLTHPGCIHSIVNSSFNLVSLQRKKEKRKKEKRKKEKRAGEKEKEPLKTMLTLRKHEPGLKFAIAVAVLVAHLFAGCDEGGRQWRPVRRLLDGQVAISTVVLTSGQVRISVIFWFEEVRQDFVVRPACVAIGRPAVVIAPVAADVQHVVEYWWAAQNFTSWPVAPVAGRQNEIPFR